jgi:ubiquinone/menaquinone biosynthesis C-methylase UbiE
MSAPAPNFDRVARMYRWAEHIALGPLLQRTRTHFIPALASKKHALVLGDGDGRFLSAFLRANDHVQAHAVDTSARMLHQLRLRCAFAQPRLSTSHQSALQVLPHRDTDLIVSHFFLDCLEQNDLEALASQIAANCSSRTTWLVSDFAIPSRQWLAPFARLYVRALYFAFRMLTGLRVTRLPNIEKALKTAGFQPISRHERLGGLLFSELWVLGPVAATGSPAHLPAQTIIEEDMALENNATTHETHAVADPLPDPEPAVPSLPEPDPGVFHHSPPLSRPATKSENE